VSEGHYTETQLAARIMADFFATTVIRKLEQGYDDLYVWEQDALRWLSDWRQQDKETFINAWTQTYIDEGGPPPWRDLETPL